MQDSNYLKQKLLNTCKEYVNERLDKLRAQIKSLEVSLHSETKSSAGDKHETGRAMVQLEREKTGQQLFEAEKLEKLISKVNIENPSAFIRLGSLVITSQVNYFIAISVGKLEVENVFYYAISPDTPIGKLLLGKKAEDEVSFNGASFRILKIK